MLDNPSLETESRELSLAQVANKLDALDPFAECKQRFHLPQNEQGVEEIYLCGHSLGCQPKSTAQFVEQELIKWQKLGVKGHFCADFPWMPYHEFVNADLAELVGAQPEEVVAMNSLTVNLHLLMASFYRPTQTRYKIVIESQAFPSDFFAMQSQLVHHNHSPDTGLIALKPQNNASLLSTEDWLSVIEEQGEAIAVVLLPAVQYLTGQVIDVETITQKAHEKGIIVGVDCAHGVGNIPLKLHQWQVDFATWCHYKYCNSGPGSIGGCFVHKRHATNTQLPRFSGWWGHDKSSRFLMKNDFKPMPTVEGWQCSNPDIFALARVRAAMAEFKHAGGVRKLREKSILLTGFLERNLKQDCPQVAIISPHDPLQRGAQLSLKLEGIDGKAVFTYLEGKGVTVDWREPHIMRVAPTPLYNSFNDVYQFSQHLAQGIQACR